MCFDYSRFLAMGLKLPVFLLTRSHFVYFWATIESWAERRRKERGWLGIPITIINQYYPKLKASTTIYFLVFHLSIVNDPSYPIPSRGRWRCPRHRWSYQPCTAHGNLYCPRESVFTHPTSSPNVIPTTNCLAHNKYVRHKGQICRIFYHQNYTKKTQLSCKTQREVCCNSHH